MAMESAPLIGRGHHATLEPRHVGVLGDGDHSHRDRKVEARALLFQIGGREIDRRARAGPAVAAVRNGGRHAIAALAHRGVGQADDDDLRVSVAGVDLDNDLARFHATNRGRENPREHAAI
jgi:hypothetical protein